MSLVYVPGAWSDVSGVAWPGGVQHGGQVGTQGVQVGTRGRVGYGYQVGMYGYWSGLPEYGTDLA